MMDTWILAARGPLFRLALAVCLLGLAYRLGTALWHVRAAHGRAGDKRLPTKAIWQATWQWLLPLRLLRCQPIHGLASFLFHLGLLSLPLFYVGHVTLWRATLPGWWPAIGPVLGDWLTLAALAGLGLILGLRLLSSVSRDLTTPADVGILLLLLALTGTGYLAAHPTACPGDPRLMVLLHILAGDLALILTPLTKIVHCVLSPLTQLLSEVGWHFPADSGRRVAVALGKENEKV